MKAKRRTLWQAVRTAVRERIRGVACDNPVKGWYLIPFENIMLTDIRYMCIRSNPRKEKIDMTEFAKVGTQQICFLALGAFLMIVVPIVIALIWKKKKKENFSTVLVGALTFLLV